MKLKIIILAFLFFNLKSGYSQINYNQNRFTGNNICNYFFNTGIFNAGNNLPYGWGIHWQCDPLKSYVFSSGVSVLGKINDSLAMITASYRGEWAPGYFNSSGEYKTNPDFKIYNIKNNSPGTIDYMNWYKMVPYGAPFQDINNNGKYDQGIDIPGVKDATQTLFIPLSSGDIGNYSTGEGFGGGIFNPLIKIDARLTIWGYNFPGLADVQFLKYQFIYKGSSPLDSFRVTFFCDPDMPNPTTKLLGCDTNLNLGYSYSSDTNNIFGAYGLMILKGIESENDTTRMSSFTEVYNSSLGPPEHCIVLPNGSPSHAYYNSKGFKNAGVNFYNPTYTPFKPTKFCYPGDPETNTGWTMAKGRVNNCLPGETGVIQSANPGNWGFLLSTGSDKIKLNPGDTQTVYIAQLLASGFSNKNSVTRLKHLSNSVKIFFNQKILNTLNNPIIQTEIPSNFNLYQNYPNPFNPVTKIKFDIPFESKVRLSIFDLNGKELTVLVNGTLNSGMYEYLWDGSEFSSGVYFIRMQSGNKYFNKKMILLK